MKIIFAGTPEFAATALKGLIESEHEVCLVLTQPDRASGRGMKLTPSAVKTLALAHDIPVATPVTLSLKKGGEEAEKVAAQTLADVKAAMKINYFDDLDLIRSQAERYGK